MQEKDVNCADISAHLVAGCLYFSSDRQQNVHGLVELCRSMLRVAVFDWIKPIVVTHLLKKCCSKMKNRHL